MRKITQMTGERFMKFISHMERGICQGWKPLTSEQYNVLCNKIEAMAK